MPKRSNYVFPILNKPRTRVRSFGHRAGGKTLKKQWNHNVSSPRASRLLDAFQREISLKFLEMLIVIKLYHWKTHSYPTHIATDDLYTKLNASMDTFVEVLLGKTGSRIALNQVHSLPVKEFHDATQFVHEINDYKSYLVSLDNHPALKTMSNTDLLNIRDEILGNLNQLLYLLTFS